MATGQAVNALPPGGPTEQVVGSALPIFQQDEDSPKQRYLGFRASGFQVREAAEMVGVSQRTVLGWRGADPEFRRTDMEGMSELRKTMGANFAYLEFLRNFRFVMIHDGKLLRKQALRPDSLSEEEKTHLREIRRFYTPKEIEIVRNALQGGAPGGGSGPTFNFTQFVMDMGRRGNQVREAIRVGE